MASATTATEFDTLVDKVDSMALSVDDNQQSDGEGDSGGETIVQAATDKKRKKKKKKSATAARLGGSTELAYESHSNAHDHAYDQDMKYVLDRLNVFRVLSSVYPNGRYEEPAAVFGAGSGGADPEKALQYLESIGLATPEMKRQFAAAAASFKAMSESGGEVLERTSNVIQERPPPTIEEFLAHIHDKSAEEVIHIVTQMATGSMAEPGMCLVGFGHHRTYAGVMCTPLQRNFLRAHPSFELPLVIEPHISKVPFRISDTPHAGKCLIATKPIAGGTIFFREPPLLVCSRKLTIREIVQFDELCERVMRPVALAAFDDLCNCKPYQGPNVSRRHCIFRTNGFGLELYPNDNGGLDSGVFQMMSRANHSCDPNCIFTWSFTTFQGGLFARRDIAAGEEISVSYLGESCTWSPTVIRRKELQEKYLFKCTCVKCGPN